MALKWTKTSGPDSCVMNPKPFSPLNHLTVPIVMDNPLHPGLIRTEVRAAGRPEPPRELPATALRRHPSASSLPSLPLRPDQRRLGTLGRLGSHYADQPASCPGTRKGRRTMRLVPRAWKKSNGWVPGVSLAAAAFLLAGLPAAVAA